MLDELAIVLIRAVCLRLLAGLCWRFCRRIDSWALPRARARVAAAKHAHMCDSFVTKQRQGRVDCAVRKACALACNAGAVPVAGNIQERMLDEGQRSTLLA